MRFGADVIEGGARFRVWAPRPRVLELEVDGQRVPAERDLLGFAEVTVPGVGPGARYYWVLDGHSRSDPASRAQPDGVLAPSQVVDPHAFRWHDADYRQPPLDAVYELHVGTFSPEGTFASVAARLDHLVASGFHCIELMPVGAWPDAHGWGYDGVSWLAPHPGYGGPDGLRALVDACHARGVAVVLDVVFNHLGPEGNYLAEFGPYFSERETGWGRALDLDGAAAGPVRAFILHAARTLVDEYHLDGVRIDAVHAFVDASPQHIVAELAAALHADGAARGRPVWVIAESDLGRTRVVEPAEAGGWGADTMWHDDFHHALHVALTGERFGYYADFGGAPGRAHAQLARVLERGFLHTGQRTPYREGPFGEPAAHLHGRSIVACAQNHDQVGNRAAGERLTTLVPGCEFAVAAAVLSAPFLPMIFMGEEHGETAPFPFFTSFEDEGLAEAVRAGRQREYGPGPDPQAPATFESARVDPRRTGERGEGLLRFYRALLDQRRARPSLAAGPLSHTEAVAHGETLLVRRWSPEEETLTAYRLAATADKVELPAPRRGRWRTALDAGTGTFGGPAGAAHDDEHITLPGWGALLLAAP